MEDIPFALGILHLREPAYLGSALSCETFRGPPSCRKVRPLNDTLHVRRFFVQILGEQNQPPRRRFCYQRRTTKCAERSLKARPQIFQSRLNHPVRNFFRADFEKEIGHYAAASSFGFCCSAQASATPTANLRTRATIPTRSVTLMAPRAS